ncbi:precorrin-3B C(17)-methyltransferase [Pseudomonas fluorescens]|uniref:Putative precorrin-3B C17-methyltransferase, cobalamin biosynthesis protein n=1 Tax=Pseudomonas fluorescens (strain Pf0-1) TaxID=205922 RepID=Q3KIQ5_PSEPF|nr:precorrin-3B C(17)-methyltransferase [Pseudomonas fluorescens]ABA72351.1 putative precorrin-3B C17-methyltransferase, cobalamin biosynthesis protein [Pseudomonas fluorescens Pf0-1]MBY9023833.1 precorrin-3B C(17)-methyltransferase [Pseudomonas fluorescens]MBY9029825.1 precorrin-3B C(17)-methyltransferase [Pseudomonas fluorescens]MBY9035167.1 precorrin-3B C(17)-methyltransferase [Pseudomonas fluorescens]MBY9041648.1 precorrin-3B C(17)-methyltransferase [Pseudomonas fluorescens]
MTHSTPAIVILGQGALATARRLQQVYPAAKIHGLNGRVEGADLTYSDFGATLRELYQQDTPIIALCAAGIVIRTLAPLLLEKGVEPPVLAVAEDGSAVVPLLGGLGGVNVMAREIAAGLEVAAAITTSGELRFGTCLLNPPGGYALGDLEQGKRFVSDLLAGHSVRIDGAAPWLEQAQLPEDPQAQRSIHVGSAARAANTSELLIYPRSVAVAVGSSVTDVPGTLRDALQQAGVAIQSLACLVAADAQMASPALREAALELAVPLRFVAPANDIGELVRDAVPGARIITTSRDIAIAVAEQPLDVSQIGRPRGRLAVIGLGPGAAELMVPAVKAELARATDVLGYETYVRMAGPFRDDQVQHCTDNREEMQRARHAFRLAAQGRSVIVVSSGDPGVFAMAAAVLEALHESTDPAWHSVDLEILPGVSASLATAAQAGAPLGHDFCVMSLSDNLKPWSIIEKRLDLAAEADLALAFYNPISRSRPWQLGRALEIVAQHRTSQTPVVLGRDIGRPGQTLRVTTLGALTPDQVDMRTMVLIGSSTTCTFPRAEGGKWVYTPRWYGSKPAG